MSLSAKDLGLKESDQIGSDLFAVFLFKSTHNQKKEHLEEVEKVILDESEAESSEEGEGSKHPFHKIKWRHVNVDNIEKDSILKTVPDNMLPCFVLVRLVQVEDEGWQLRVRPLFVSAEAATGITDKADTDITASCLKIPLSPKMEYCTKSLRKVALAILCEIRHDQFLKSEETKKMIVGSYTITGDQNTDRGQHLMFEVLQNADDEGVEAIEFYTSEDKHGQQKLTVYTEKETFFLRNVNAISLYHNSSKLGQDEKTGEKGIGFKSLLMGCNRVLIISNDYYFCLKPGLDSVLPLWSEEAEAEGLRKGTSIVAHRRSAVNLSTFKASHLRFLRNIRKVTVNNDCYEFKEVQDRVWEETSLVGEKLSSSKFLRFHYEVDCGECQRPGRKRKEENTAIVIDFPEPRSESYDYTLFAYLPLEGKKLFDRFLLNADFVTKPNREGLAMTPEGDAWNTFLLNAMPDALAQCCMQFNAIQGHELLKVPFLYYFPHEMAKRDDRLFKLILEKFKSLSCVLCEGKFLKPSNKLYFLNSKEERKVLNNFRNEVRSIVNLVDYLMERNRSALKSLSLQEMTPELIIRCVGKVAESLRKKEWYDDVLTLLSEKRFDAKSLKKCRTLNLVWCKECKKAVCPKDIRLSDGSLDMIDHKDWNQISLCLMSSKDIPEAVSKKLDITNPTSADVVNLIKKVRGSEGIELGEKLNAWRQIYLFQSSKRDWSFTHSPSLLSSIKDVAWIYCQTNGEDVFSKDRFKKPGEVFLPFHKPFSESALIWPRLKTFCVYNFYVNDPAFWKEAGCRNYSWKELEKEFPFLREQYGIAELQKLLLELEPSGYYYSNWECLQSSSTQNRNEFVSLTKGLVDTGLSKFFPFIEAASKKILVKEPVHNFGTGYLQYDYDFVSSSWRFEASYCTFLRDMPPDKLHAFYLQISKSDQWKLLLDKPIFREKKGGNLFKKEQVRRVLSVTLPDQLTLERLKFAEGDADLLGRLGVEGLSIDYLLESVALELLNAEKNDNTRMMVKFLFDQVFLCENMKLFNIAKTAVSKWFSPSLFSPVVKDIVEKILPDAKFVNCDEWKIDPNTPQVQGQLEALGIKITPTLDDVLCLRHFSQEAIQFLNERKTKLKSSSHYSKLRNDVRKLDVTCLGKCSMRLVSQSAAVGLDKKILKSMVIIPCDVAEEVGELLNIRTFWTFEYLAFILQRYYGNGTIDNDTYACWLEKLQEERTSTPLIDTKWIFFKGNWLSVSQCAWKCDFAPLDSRFNLANATLFKNFERLFTEPVTPSCYSVILEEWKQGTEFKQDQLQSIGQLFKLMSDHGQVPSCFMTSYKGRPSWSGKCNNLVFSDRSEWEALFEQEEVMFVQLDSIRTAESFGIQPLSKLARWSFQPSGSCEKNHMVKEFMEMMKPFVRLFDETLQLPPIQLVERIEATLTLFGITKRAPENVFFQRGKSFESNRIFFCSTWRLEDKIEDLASCLFDDAPSPKLAVPLRDQLFNMFLLSGSKSTIENCKAAARVYCEKRGKAGLQLVASPMRSSSPMQTPTKDSTTIPQAQTPTSSTSKVQKRQTKDSDQNETESEERQSPLRKATSGEKGPKSIEIEDCKIEEMRFEEPSFEELSKIPIKVNEGTLGKEEKSSRSNTEGDGLSAKSFEESFSETEKEEVQNVSTNESFKQEKEMRNLKEKNPSIKKHTSKDTGERGEAAAFYVVPIMLPHILGCDTEQFKIISENTGDEKWKWTLTFSAHGKDGTAVVGTAQLVRGTADIRIEWDNKEWFVEVKASEDNSGFKLLQTQLTMAETYQDNFYVLYFPKVWTEAEYIVFENITVLLKDHRIKYEVKVKVDAEGEAWRRPGKDK